MRTTTINKQAGAGQGVEGMSSNKLYHFNQ
jgi:hypothetical protein